MDNRAKFTLAAIGGYRNEFKDGDGMGVGRMLCGTPHNSFSWDPTQNRLRIVCRESKAETYRENPPGDRGWLSVLGLDSVWSRMDSMSECNVKLGFKVIRMMYMARIIFRTLRGAFYNRVGCGQAYRLSN